MKNECGTIVVPNWFKWTCQELFKSICCEEKCQDSRQNQTHRQEAPALVHFSGCTHVVEKTQTCWLLGYFLFENDRIPNKKVPFICLSWLPDKMCSQCRTHWSPDRHLCNRAFWWQRWDEMRRDETKRFCLFQDVNTLHCERERKQPGWDDQGCRRRANSLRSQIESDKVKRASCMCDTCERDLKIMNQVWCKLLALRRPVTHPSSFTHFTGNITAYVCICNVW